MITASDIFNRVKSLLDDDDSGRYTEADDFVPALNAAVEYLTMVFNAGFEQKKIFPEILSELSRTAILAIEGTGTTRRIDITTLHPSIWTIFGVDPNPSVGGSPEVLVESRDRWAAKLTLEEWNDKSEDPFSPGTSQVIPGTFVKTAYIGPGRYIDSTHVHLFIRPGYAIDDAAKAAIWYLAHPETVTSGSSTLSFPTTIINFLVQKTMYYMAYQHGPESKYLPVTEKELMGLISLIGR